MGADDMSFVADCLQRRVPTAHIARMTNRPHAEVQRVQAMLEEAARQPQKPVKPVAAVLVEFASPRWLEVAARNQTLARKIEHLAIRWNVSPSDIFGDGRRKAIAGARQELMHHLRFDLGWKFPRIGKFLHRDHSTCVYGAHEHRKRLARQAREAA